MCMEGREERKRGREEGEKEDCRVKGGGTGEREGKVKKGREEKWMEIKEEPE